MVTDYPDIQGQGEHETFGRPADRRQLMMNDAGPLPASASPRCYSCSPVQPAAGARRSVWRR